ncbi:sulfate ABC transporter permease subunit CysW [Marinobacter sp.]|jgi:sulfate transport system permease protein|uniref:sulfate ABC transporter permease subunit CysW n=1 Tax=Marinobacter sp. TaxID=50741 RepID=UPI0019A4749E|nr:sulfate ABC transporter permease subunit CysW [Marinobacter sp.]MBC7191617.1 sulfate ABC transporter permease subunit CysW [Marinobacter sp.]
MQTQTLALDRLEQPGARQWPRYVLTGLAILIISVFLLLPLATVLIEAFSEGWDLYVQAINDRYTWEAIKLTLLVATVVVPLNTVFGIAAAWMIARFRFRGRGVLTTLIDLPFSISPVIAGLIFVLVFGTHGWFGSWFAEHGFPIIFAAPGIILATLFITVPFVARELIPLMQEQGSEEEEAAIALGAGSWTMFRKITLPKIKWGLLYGIILCNARAMGEFGAVSVVSGHIRGKTNTLPLHVEILYNEYNFTAAFAVASLLAGLAILTLILKSLVEWQQARSLERATQ